MPVSRSGQSTHGDYHANDVALGSEDGRLAVCGDRAQLVWLGFAPM